MVYTPLIMAETITYIFFSDKEEYIHICIYMMGGMVDQLLVMVCFVCSKIDLTNNTLHVGVLRQLRAWCKIQGPFSFHASKSSSFYPPICHSFSLTHIYLFPFSMHAFFTFPYNFSLPFWTSYMYLFIVFLLLLPKSKIYYS